MARNRDERGWLRLKKRKQGPTWILRFYATNPGSGRRVEHTKVIGLKAEFPTADLAWEEVQRQCPNMSEPDFKARSTFADLANHYIQHELQATKPKRVKSHTTRAAYLRILNNRLLPRWGERPALRIQPLEIEQWLEWLQDNEKLENPTLDKFRRVMALVYQHGQIYGLIPRTQEANPLNFVRQSTLGSYEAFVLTPEETLRILREIEEQDVRTLVLLIASTGLRISEALALTWRDVDWPGQKIYVRQAWTQGQFGRPKSKASKAPVPLAPLLARYLQEWHEQTPYGGSEDFVFPSMKLKGKQPRTASIIVEDYLRPAAARAGVLSSHINKEGELVEDDPRRFGFHNLRHSIASLLVNSGEAPKIAQSLLRHSDLKTTLGLYVHTDSAATLAAQERVLAKILPMGVIE
jgi:integrase